MEDNQIIELFWQRDESAITETGRKYGAYCRTIANNILQNNCWAFWVRKREEKGRALQTLLFCQTAL